MPVREITHFLSIAKKAVVLAGKFLLKVVPSGRKVKFDMIHDVKLTADIQSERLLIDYLKGKSNFSILSEESGMMKGRDQGFLWVVDPIDGSLNYFRQIPFCCVSLGLWQEDKPLLGAIYDFNRSELFWGIADQGAWLNDNLLSVSKMGTKQKAVLCTGFPVKTDFSLEYLHTFVRQIQSYRKVRLLGSAALSIAYVACGRVDAYDERDIMFWDVAGGIPIVLGAGGKMKMEKTTQPGCFHVHITNGCI